MSDSADSDYGKSKGDKKVKISLNMSSQQD